jgi:lipoate-protein ligase A
VTRRICEAFALGLNKLGVPARYRPRNDLEVDGRKISGTGGFFDGSLIFYQGTLLIDFDASRIAACLNVPAEKLAKRELDSATKRVITMREVLGDKLPDLKAIYDGLLWASPKDWALRRSGVLSRLSKKNWPLSTIATRSAPTPMWRSWMRRLMTI